MGNKLSGPKKVFRFGSKVSCSKIKRYEEYFFINFVLFHCFKYAGKFLECMNSIYLTPVHRISMGSMFSILLLFVAKISIYYNLSVF